MEELDAMDLPIGRTPRRRRIYIYTYIYTCSRLHIKLIRSKHIYSIMHIRPTIKTKLIKKIAKNLKIFTKSKG